MKVVINRTDAIGDTILTLPMAKKLKDHFTNCYVIFVITPKTEPIFESNTIVDEYWIYDEKASKLKSFFSTMKAALNQGAGKFVELNVKFKPFKKKKKKKKKK